MMLLRHFYLYLDLLEYPDEVTTTFGFVTRYFCNFIERRAKSLRFKTQGFSKLCVRGVPTSEDSCSIVSENSLDCPVAFDIGEYESLSLEDRHEFFIEMFSRGIEKCRRDFEIPYDEIMQFIDEFRQGGYVNRWTHQSKLLRPAGIRASLYCDLDMNRFLLTLRLDRKGEVVFKKSILKTKPDEIIFYYRFKEVVLEGEEIVVKERNGETLFSVNLNAVDRG